MSIIGAVKNSITGKTQADGAQVIGLQNADSALIHQIHVEVSATPTAGTLTVEVKTPGATDYIAVSGTIDLTSIALFKIEGLAESIRVTPSGFDADKSYDVYVTSGDMQ